MKGKIIYLALVLLVIGLSIIAVATAKVAWGNEVETIELGNNWQGNVWKDPFGDNDYAYIRKSAGDGKTLQILVYPNWVRGNQLWLIFNEREGTFHSDTMQWQIKVDDNPVWECGGKTKRIEYGESWRGWYYVENTMGLDDESTLVLCAQISTGQHFYARAYADGEWARFDIDLTGSLYALQWLCAEPMARETMMKLRDSAEAVMDETAEEMGF
jgi:hypothetical protein